MLNNSLQRDEARINALYHQSVRSVLSEDVVPTEAESLEFAALQVLFILLLYCRTQLFTFRIKVAEFSPRKAICSFRHVSLTTHLPSSQLSRLSGILPNYRVPSPPVRTTWTLPSQTWRSPSALTILISINWCVPGCQIFGFSYLWCFKYLNIWCFIHSQRPVHDPVLMYTRNVQQT